MLRILGVQRSETADLEFVLLQNQSSLRVQLKGHVIVSDTVVCSGNPCAGLHVFSDDVMIPAGMYVILYTGTGEARWSRTKDGQHVYHTYMERTQPVWSNEPGPLHILATQHTYQDRREMAFTAA